MSKPTILVTGKQGQLGWELMQLAATYHQYDIVFFDRTALDITDTLAVAACVEKHQPAYFVNCAAYTAVDKAETAQTSAYQINAAAPGAIAGICRKDGIVFITISTDYVFNGNGTKPYATEDPTDPVNYYGYTKQLGEQMAMANNPATVIIRTSWVYSSHGNNFVKTMMRLMKERDSLNVVADQQGSPTYAYDLALAIMDIIGQLEKGNRQYGIFHFSNTGITNWYEFAKAIRDNAGLSCTLNAITTAEYPTPAKRPMYSVMDTNKIHVVYGIEMRDWKTALNACMQKMQS